MMTNVLMGFYPDVFAAGAANAGVAFGCFAGDGIDVWNTACAEGQVIKTGAQWAAIVDAAHPSYTGTRPKMQVFHGLADTTLYPQNLQEEIKEWTAVLGLPSSPISTTLNTPLTNWTKYVYGSTFEAYSAAEVTHQIPFQDEIILNWFGLLSASIATSATTSTKVSSTTLKTTTTKSSTSTTATTTWAGAGGTVPKWGQCGGSG